MRTATLLAVLIAISSLTTGCSTYYEHRFAPAPVEVELYVDGDAESQARGLVTMLGIRRPADGRGAVVEGRIRIENVGANSARLVPEALTLVSADLQEIGRGQAEPAPRPIAQGDTGTYQIEFEMPAGRTPRDYDLQGMNLKWEVDFGDQRVLTGITFDRTVLPHSRKPRVSFGFGYVHTR